MPTLNFNFTYLILFTNLVSGIFRKSTFLSEFGHKHTTLREIISGLLLTEAKQLSWVDDARVALKNR